jgi:hypothetical protein
MIAARDCKDVSDLSARLQKIYIEEQHLNFGEIKFQYSETEDFLDQCISNNIFPELDTFICPVCGMNLGLAEGDDDVRYMKHMEKEHEIRQKKLFNLFPFLLLGQPSFSYACFEDGLYEYDSDWTIDEKYFLINCKCHFQNSKRLTDHETIHKKHNLRRKAILPPFWKFIKVNTPKQSDPKFFDYLHINNHPWFKSLLHRFNAKVFKDTVNFSEL